MGLDRNSLGKAPVRIPTVVIIPIRFQAESLIKLLGSVLSDYSVDKIILYDNGSEGAVGTVLHKLKYMYPKITTYEASGKGIYQMWNMGWKAALGYAEGPVNVAILNDDCFFWPGTLHTMAYHLRASDKVAVTFPDTDVPLTTELREPEDYETKVTQGIWGQGGMTGFCFVFKGELSLPFIDENFSWWYGDDDFVKQVELAGYTQEKIIGLPLYHIWGQSSRLLDQTEIQAKIVRDNAYFNQKYGESRSL